MTTYLRPQVARLRDISKRLGKPIVFTEIGCRSRAGAAMKPSDYQLPGAYDGREQAAYLEAVWRSFW